MSPSDHSGRRGELRIYLGAAPGVGKTFAMLGEAHRRVERGTDLVAAVVETHGRKKTAELLDGIETVPPKMISYRGRSFPELDVGAVLKRNPQVVLVDELAHTNTPGSRNPKRWQDIEELLDAGITVVTTVNVQQHLESLNDVVTQITGIEQQEKVPDDVVRAADQIELVDITPEALRRRLAHGNVYAPERIDAALSNDFRPGNLTALRELALLWLADQVDAALEKYRADNKITDTWEVRASGWSSPSPAAWSRKPWLRRASRIASKSSAELMVVHVVRGDGLSGVSAPTMGRVRELAVSLGATLHTVVGDSVAANPAALLDFAREMNATQLVLGTSRRSRWARVFDQGIGATVVQRSGKIDVHMVTHESAGGESLWSRVTPRERHVASWLAALVRVVGHLRGDRAAVGPVSGHRRRERGLLHWCPDRRIARRCCAGCTFGGSVRPAARLLPRRTAIHLHHLRARQRDHHRGVARCRRRCRRPRRRSRHPRPRSSAGSP